MNLKVLKKPFEKNKKFYSDKKDRITFNNVYLGKLFLHPTAWTKKLLPKLKVIGLFSLNIWNIVQELQVCL